jgi:hypothetical protein
MSATPNIQPSRIRAGKLSLTGTTSDGSTNVLELYTGGGTLVTCFNTAGTIITSGGTACIGSPIILASNYICSPTITGSTKVCSPIICGTSCVSSPIILASTRVCSPIITGSTKVCSPILFGTTCVSSPIVFGTTCVSSPIVIGTTCACSPIVCSTTCFIGANLAGSGTRSVNVTAAGALSPGSAVLDGIITDSTTITNLSNDANWSSAIYTGATITGQYAGTLYSNITGATGTYIYFMYTDTYPIRICRV